MQTAWGILVISHTLNQQNPTVVPNKTSVSAHSTCLWSGIALSLISGSKPLVEVMLQHTQSCYFPPQAGDPTIQTLAQRMPGCTHRTAHSTWSSLKHLWAPKTATPQMRGLRTTSEEREMDQEAHRVCWYKCKCTKSVQVLTQWRKCHKAQ